MKGKMMDSGAAPCIECRTEGGYTPKNQRKPVRRRGMCSVCYWRHWNHGTMRVDVQQATSLYPDHETMLWHTPSGERQRHAISPTLALKVGPAVDARWEDACAEWMRLHPEQALIWDDPSLALFPATEARAA